MQEKYLIGHVSHLLNISKDTLRYYDKLGIVSPKKDTGNGYRYYTLEDLLTLSYVLVLRDLKIPLESIKHFITQNTLRDFATLLETQEALVDEKIAKLLKLKEKVISFKNQIEIAETLHTTITQSYSPPLVFQRTTKEWDAHYADYLSEMENNPTLTAPLFSLIVSKDFLIPNFNDATYSFGVSGIVKDLSDSHTLHAYTYLPPTLCLHTVIQATDIISPDDLKIIHDYMEQNPVTICGDLIARNIAFEHKNETPIDYYEIWIPVNVTNNY